MLPFINCEVKYLLIVSIDVYSWDRRLSSIKPAYLNSRKNFRVTESERDSELVKQHRKYYGTMTKEELVHAIDIYDLCISDSCDTLGALTFEYGILPAISWNDCEDDYSINIYISPLLETSAENTICEQLDNIKKTESTYQAERIAEHVRNKLDNVLTLLKENYDEPEKFIDNIGVNFSQIELELEVQNESN